ncbi:MAG: DUF1827 family protein, partial [Streptococcus sp.]
ISNMHRAVREQEIEKIREFFLKRKIDANTIDRAAIRTIYANNLIEISIPVKQ